MRVRPLFEPASDQGFCLLNTPGTYVRLSFSGCHRASAIDLAFVNPHILPAFRQGDTSSLPSKGSDHVPIVISLRPLTCPCLVPRPWWEDTHWPSLTVKLDDWQVPLPPISLFPRKHDLWFSTALNVLRSTIVASAPRSRRSTRSNPWWTPLLTTLP